MARARDLLERFRPIGAPGAAAPVGVPADRAADREHELGPVFELLDDAVDECARIRHAATTEATRRRAEAAAEAIRIRDEASREAPVERARAAAQARREHAGEVETILARSRRDANLLAVRSAQRIDTYVERVVESVRRWPDETGESPS